jgi:hypothetical protein
VGCPGIFVRRSFRLWLRISCDRSSIVTSRTCTKPKAESNQKKAGPGALKGRIFSWQHSSHLRMLPQLYLTWVHSHKIPLNYPQ